MGVALGIASSSLAQDRQIRREDRQVRRDIRRGEVVRVNPETNTIVLRNGTGAEAKEFEYHVAPSTKYWGTDRRAFNEGLRHKDFRVGNAVWYTPGVGDDAAVSEVWFADPNSQVPIQNGAYIEGKIVRVDPATNLVVVRTTTGEVEYRVDPNTGYWGTDQQAFTTGLRYEGFRAGAPIWFHVGAGDRSHFMSEIRFHDPAVKVENRRK